ncbi:hypothetical protein [Paracoccus lutimaris]|uniref:Uncharacterized protein n=1 Tax=Paracoccus lutimaris TaxID=1490030 RepID=A0A368YJR1_9RHOB|nr:hypothetical protein [Paracoccus lutimaris]RCW80482.1 hypothetical protein DFP89_11941 [Paracoccus lutimaris]
MLAQSIYQLVQGLRISRHKGQFDAPNLDGTAGDCISFAAREWAFCGLAQLWLQTADQTGRATHVGWYAGHLAKRLPPRHIDIAAPMLALAAIMRHFGSDGVVGQVPYGTPIGHDLQFHRDIPIQPTGYGRSMALLLLVEALNQADG